MRAQGRYWWWTLIVGANSFPGALFAWNSFDTAGILTAVAIWSLIYLWLVNTGLATALLAMRSFRYALGTAIAIRAIPLSWIVDFFLGALITGGSVAANAPGSLISEDAFLYTLRAALIHGLVINVLFWPLVVALDVVVFWFVKNTPRPGVCVVCGYDLRASPVRCPECGTPNPNPNHAPLAEPQAQPPD